MADRPSGRMIQCPECGKTAHAIVPKLSEVVEDEETADGKVWVNCHECGERFLIYYRNKE